MTVQPSKDALERAARDLLKDANLDLVTAKTVRKSLEDHFKCDLTDRKKEIGQVIDRIINEAKSDSSSSDDEEIKKHLKSQAKKSFKSNSSSKDNDSKKTKKEEKESSDSEVDDEEVARRLQEEEGKRPTRSGQKPKKTAVKRKSKKGDRGDDISDDNMKKKRKTGSNGFTKSLTLSPDLANFMGESSMPRHEVVKKVWSYVKEHNLMDPKNKQFAICDSTLLKIIGKKRFRMFGMMKDLSRHFQKD